MVREKGSTFEFAQKLLRGLSDPSWHGFFTWKAVIKSRLLISVHAATVERQFFFTSLKSAVRGMGYYFVIRWEGVL